MRKKISLSQSEKAQLMKLKAQINPLQVEDYSIYDNQPSSQQEIEQDRIEEVENEQSSFELEPLAKESSEQDKKNIQKFLDRLGLNTAHTGVTKNQELEMVVNNFVENCIETIDHAANIQQYDQEYDPLYQEKLKARQPFESTIYISELTQLQAILRMDNSGLKSICRSILLMFRYISMTCQVVIYHPLFEGFILFVIMMNSLKMATDDPLSTTSSLPWVQTAFTTIYVIQMSLKIMAFGFVLNKGSYLRDMWNIMDFCIVITSLLPLVINLNFSVSALRAFRVLRPLRTITKIKALKQIMKTLFYSFSLVMDSIYILLFIIFVLAIAGMQLFGGNLKNVCMNTADGSLTSTLCTSSSDCSSIQLCAKGIASPNFSVLNFDTLIWSALNVFQSITMEGWSQIMEDIQRTNGFIYCIYSLLIVFICEYILLNMTLAILKYKYAQVKDNLIEEEEEEKEEYEPQFLKKIGIFQDLSVLSNQMLLFRANNPSKHQVGCSRTLPTKELAPTISLNQLLSYVDESKQTQKIIQIKKGEINVQELKQLGKLTDHKWDSKQLQFQENILNEKYIEIIEGKAPSDKTIQGKQDEEEEDLVDDSFDSSMDERLESSDSQSEEALQKQRHFVELALNTQQILHRKSLVNDLEIKNFSKQPNPNTEFNQIKKKHFRQVSQLDKLLSLIGGKAGTTPHHAIIPAIPDIDFNSIIPETVFERFADLGDYSLKRSNKNELKLLDIPAVKKKIHKQNKRKQMPIQAAIEQSALDINELHLKNQLEKKVLRCRVKPDDIIDRSRRYDVMRVVASLRLKEVEEKKEEIEQNMTSMNFQVRYRPCSEKKQNSSSIFARNLENQKLLLKIPDLSGSRSNFLAKREERQNSTTSIKSKDNSKYLKLLQNYQMEDRIELTLDRVMTTFFKPQTFRKQQMPEKEQSKINAQQEYELIIQEDILKRHGHLELQFPVNILQQEEEMLETLNIRKEEYEINIRGFKGFWRVARKKTLLFVSSSFYDNFMLTIVLLNTFLMSMSGFINTDLPPYFTINEVFTIMFTLDLVLKIFAYGVSFFSDVMNIFDTGVVAISLMELLMGGSGMSGLRSIRILRAFRVLRITRLIRSLNYMRIIMNVISSVINQFIYVFLLLFLFIFIFTLLGMQIFGGTYVPQSVSGIRQNFDSFFNAFFVIFQVMTVENWNDIELATSLSNVGPWGILFLVSWIFLGNWILLSLLQAILLDGFDDDSTNPEDEANPQEIESKLSQVEYLEDETVDIVEDDEDEKESNSSEKQINFDIEDASLFIFKPDNPIRRMAIYVTTSTVYQVIMFIIILLSSGKLAFDTYLEAEGPIVQIAALFDYILNFIFITECFLKVIARGFIVGEESYMKNSWNRLDFFIVCISIMDMVLAGVNLSIIKLLRTLRPLRIITRNQGMKIMVTSLMQSILGIINLLIIVMCVYLMFAILGMNLLQGKLDFCNINGSNLSTGNYGPYGISQDDCSAQGGIWTTQLINFQNVAHSMISLYVFSTRQNWPYYVYTFIDASEAGPVKDNNQILYFGYAILFIFICSLFFMDLLVGVLFTNYHQAENKICPKTLSDKQINWKNLQQLIVSEDPCFQLFIAPENGVRRLLFQIVSTKAFEIFIAVIIIFNIGIMAVSNDDIPIEKGNLLVRLNSACSYLFIAQLSLKLFLYGKAYFLSAWNIFDFFVVAASILDIILTFQGGSKNAALSLLPQIARIFRVLRITRLLRMLKRFKGLQKLIETFVFSLPAISKAFSILMLYLFIASILASNLMGGLYGDYSHSFTSILNYMDFHNAFELLFVNLSGQNWYYYMFFSTTEGYAQCDSTLGDCVSSFYYLFWLFFQFFGQKVFLQLFVLIVLDQFELNYIRQHNPLGIFSLYEEDFRQKWIAVTTKHHSQKIETKNLINLMLTLRPPLGLGREETLAKYKSELQDNDKSTPTEIEQKMSELDKKLKKNAAILLNKMNLSKNRIYFGYHETLYHFIKLAIVPEFIADSTAEQLKQMEQMHKNSQQALDKLKPSGNLFYYGELGAEDDNTQPLNPISLILFTQMIVKGWHNYSIRGKNINRSKQDSYNPFDSLNDSCASDLNEALYQKIPPQKRLAFRRGGLMENKLEQKCEFLPINHICGAYEEGRKTKNKISVRSSRLSVSRKSRNSSSLYRRQTKFTSFKKSISHFQEDLNSLRNE